VPQARSDTSGIRFPPPLVFALGFAVGYGLQRLAPVPLVPAALHGAERGIGWSLVAVGVALMGSAVATFRRAGTSPNPFTPTTALVTRGPYRFTRNPMYVGWVAVYLGATLLTRALWPLVLLPAAVFVMGRRVIALEEAYLERTFGDEYRTYKARVRRWL
jgi:protein-S-isoprenylcysteine O-methyltransferase Ste14